MFVHEGVEILLAGTATGRPSVEELVEVRQHVLQRGELLWARVRHRLTDLGKLLIEKLPAQLVQECFERATSSTRGEVVALQFADSIADAVRKSVEGEFRESGFVTVVQ